MLRRSILIVFVLCIVNAAQSQQPFLYWNFDGAQPLTDIIKGKKADTARYRCAASFGKGKVGNAVFPAKNCLLVTDAFVGQKNLNALSIEFLFKGNMFFYSSFPRPDLRLVFEYDYIQFTTTMLSGGKSVTDQWIVNLRGSGITSFNNLADDKWHHIVFRIDGATGNKQIWIDGQTDELLTKKVDKFSSLILEGGDAFKFTQALDELAYYNSNIPDNLIRAHAAAAALGKGYSASVSNDVSMKAAGLLKQNPPPAIDPKEFAPGYPEYTVQATDQLKSFPDPRFLRDIKLPRNFPWLDIFYLHRELPGRGGKKAGALNPEKAVSLVDEMATRWNYYAEVKCLRTDTPTADKIYADPNSLEYALIRYANNNPSTPTASVIMQVQNKPVQAGYDRPNSFIMAQDLPDKYYLKAGNGKVIEYGNKKWLSPLAPLDIIEKDANTTVTYLRQLAKFLKKPITMLNDNGEVYGHMRPKELFDQDPQVVKLQKQLNLNNAQFNGWFQNRLDSCYKNTILNRMGWKNTYFTIYNTSAVNSNYWPDYAFRRNTNSLFNGTHRSTPSFYPASPWNWRLATGQYNGYGVIAEGRKKEIAMGDKFFAPFISPGWGLEEENIRPAQWLGLLKSMVMLGADFFHVGYFNVTGRYGWPNGQGPNDPRGYIYQVAMPAYAQAIASRIYPFLEKGELLDPGYGNNARGFEYRFPTGNENEFVMVRKLGSRYLIFGSTQPNSNFLNNTPIETETSIKLAGRDLQFKIRRQGSMYVLDLSNAAKPLWYQLDGWHQYEHPWYWSGDVWLEAENADQASDKAKILTSGTASTYDFRSFESYRNLPANYWIQFNPALQHNNYTPVLKVRNAGPGTATINISLNGIVQKISVNEKNWRDITLPAYANGKQEKSVIIRIQTISGTVDIDRVLLKKNN